MSITELLFGFGGAVAGGAVGVFVQRLVTRRKTAIPSVVAAPAWAKTTDPIPVVASNGGRPYSNCIFCGASWRMRRVDKDHPAEIGPVLWENVSKSYGGPVWPKISQGFAIQYCTDCGAHWAYTTLSKDSIAEIRVRVGTSVERKRASGGLTDEERAWEEVEESLKAKCVDRESSQS